jgi:hypothetical protein
MLTLIQIMNPIQVINLKEVDVCGQKLGVFAVNKIKGV